MSQPNNARDESLAQYLVDEFVEDYQEGKMSRRDALKRIAGIVGGLAVAESILAACAPPPTLAPTAAPTAMPAPTTAPTLAPTVAPTTAAPAATTAPTAAPAASGDLKVSADDPSIEAKMITYPGQGGVNIIAYLAKPKGDGPFPAILVCHENRGLTDHIKDVTRRVAKAGYVGLGVDLLSRQGGLEKITDAATVPGLLANAPQTQNVQDFKDGMTYLNTQAFVSKGKFGMVGFCFGGGVTWRAATGIPELKAAVPYYGLIPPVEDVPKINAAVLAMYGETDTRITSSAAPIEEAMKKNNKTFDKMIYKGAGHAFNNDTGGSYNADAAKDAWAKTLAWFDKYVKA